MAEKEYPAIHTNLRDYWVGIPVTTSLTFVAGAALEIGSITVPENSIVKEVFAVVTQQAVSASGTVHISAGPNAADPDGYLEEFDIEAASVDDVVGDVVAEIGTDLKETGEGRTLGKFIAAGGYVKVYDAIGTATATTAGKAMVYARILKLEGL